MYTTEQVRKLLEDAKFPTEVIESVIKSVEDKKNEADMLALESKSNQNIVVTSVKSESEEPETTHVVKEVDSVTEEAGSVEEETQNVEEKSVRYVTVEDVERLFKDYTDKIVAVVEKALSEHNSLLREQYEILSKAALEGSLGNLPTPPLKEVAKTGVDGFDSDEAMDENDPLYHQAPVLEVVPFEQSIL